MVDFAYPYTISPLTFITTLPSSVSNSSSSFFHQVFDPSVWLLSFITMMVLYYLLQQFGKCYNNKYFGLWTMIEILFQQKFKEISYNSKLISGLLLGWLYFCTTMTTFYSNCIYSFMIKPTHIDIINTIDHLIEAKMQDQIEICTIIYNYVTVKVYLSFLIKDGLRGVPYNRVMWPNLCLRPLGYLGLRTQIIFCIRPGVITRLYGIQKRSLESKFSIL